MKDFLLLKKDDFIVDQDGNARVIDKDKNAKWGAVNYAKFFIRRISPGAMRMISVSEFRAF